MKPLTEATLPAKFLAAGSQRQLPLFPSPASIAQRPIIRKLAGPAEPGFRSSRPTPLAPELPPKLLMPETHDGR